MIFDKAAHIWVMIYKAIGYVVFVIRYFDSTFTLPISFQLCIVLYILKELAGL